MPIYPLDRVRNAAIDHALEPLLAAVREEVAAFPFEDELDGAAVEDVLEAFDAARPRLNVIASLLADLGGARGADISTGLGFLPAVLRRLGLEVIATEHEPAAGRFERALGDILPYTIGGTAPAIPAGSLLFLVCAEVLEHLNRSPVRVLRELAALLADDGRLILTTPNVARLDHIRALAAGENFLEPFDESVPPDRPATDFVEHVREYSVREVVDAIEAAGLGVDEVLMTGWGEHGYAPLTNPYANDLIVVRATK